MESFSSVTTSLPPASEIFSYREFSARRRLRSEIQPRVDRLYDGRAQSLLAFIRDFRPTISPRDFRPGACPVCGSHWYGISRKHRRAHDRAHALENALAEQFPGLVPLHVDQEALKCPEVAPDLADVAARIGHTLSTLRALWSRSVVQAHLGSRALKGLDRRHPDWIMWLGAAVFDPEHEASGDPRLERDAVQTIRWVLGRGRA